MRFVLFVISMVTLAGLAAACSSEDKGGGKVNVALKEWGVSTDRPDVPKGDVQFEVKNEGPDHDHEMIIIRTDLAPNALPFEDNGVPEEKVNIIGEIEPFAAKSKASSTFNLPAGKYVLICNITEIENGAVESHYNMGMRVVLTVQ